MTLEMVRRVVHEQAVVKRHVLPKSSLLIFVDNDTPSAAGDAMRAACKKEGLLYVRNANWSRGFGFELGAWRWAVLHELPTHVGVLAPDTLVYLMQDSMTLARWPLLYPPPASFRAASLLSFVPESSLMLGVAATPKAQREAWTAVTSNALRRVQHM